ncbi:MAG: hypothetical protein ABIO84_02485, partial [Lysobacter sp.]
PTPGEDYQLRVGGVWFGEPERSSRFMTPPRYPEGMAREGIGAKAVLVLQLDAAGDVMQVHAEQVSLDRDVRPVSQAERVREAFAKASITAARKWKFGINEVLAGRTIGTSVQVPVEFFLTDSVARRNEDPGANQWRSYIPGPRVRAPWLEETAVAARDEDVDQLKDGDVRSLASHFQLKNEVVGSLL